MIRILANAILSATLAMGHASALAQADSGTTTQLQPEKQSPTIAETFRQKRRAALYSRPGYSERTLREDNLDDREVLQIEQVTRTVIPGSIVSIGGVWGSCPCEDGDECDNQVWVVASTPAKSTGVMLSKINDTWSIGPVQQWWFEYEKYETRVADLNQRRRQADYLQFQLLNEERRQLIAEQVLLIDRFPFCGADDLEK